MARVVCSACLFAGLVVMMAPCANAQPPTPLTIGSATGAAGQMGSGFIEVPAGVDAASRVPVTIIRGAAAGPTLALVGGTHGSEVAPILALQRLRKSIDPARLRGTVIIVHIANLPSFLGRTIYYSPVDGKNLNRVYPGKADGTVSERIAYAITRDVITRADYLVDMHAGDGNESLRSYSYWHRAGVDPRVDSVAREMTLAFGHDHVVIDTTLPRDPAASVYTANTAHIRGKPGITTETGYLGVPVEEMIQRNEQGALRLLRYLKMLPGEVAMVDRPVWLDHTAVLRSPATGVWFPLVERGHTVASGALIGYVTDFFGDRLAEIRAPFAGEILYVVGTPAMSQGEPVGMVGRASQRD